MTHIRTDGGVRCIARGELGKIRITLLDNNDQPCGEFTFDTMSRALEWLETIEPVNCNKLPVSG